LRGGQITPEMRQQARSTTAGEDPQCLPPTRVADETAVPFIETSTIHDGSPLACAAGP